jgi:DNA repair exonuclease SbcCD nuclease subunit
MEKPMQKQTRRKITCLAIGDPHFSEKHLVVSNKFVDKVLQVAEARRPKFIVVLGDLLDTMNVVKIPPHKLANKFLKGLGLVAPTYLLVGNHDYINETQFLSDNHIYTPYQGVEAITNVHIVDKPTLIHGGWFQFVACPYVEPGRFMEALQTHPALDTDTPKSKKCTRQLDSPTKSDHPDPIDSTDHQKTPKKSPQGDFTRGKWSNIDAVFAHQEFLGAKMGAIVSEKGDEWPSNYPPVISGHIHEAQVVTPSRVDIPSTTLAGTKESKPSGVIHYTGSAMQHSFSEGHKKGIWLITFRRSSEHHRGSFTHELIPTSLKTKLTLTATVEMAQKYIADKGIPASTFPPGQDATSLEIRLLVQDTIEKLESFQKIGGCEHLNDLSIKVVLTPLGSVVTTPQQLNFPDGGEQKTPDTPAQNRENDTPNNFLTHDAPTFWDILHRLLESECEEWIRDLAAPYLAYKSA